MIVVLIALTSLCAIYFTRLLSKRNMRVAAVSVAVLYVYIIAWTYAVFILDVADLGFSETETRLTLLHGSDIYHSFVSLTDKMSVIPLALLEAIVAVVGIVLFASFAVAFHGLFEITKAVVKAAKDKKKASIAEAIKNKILSYFGAIKPANIIRLNCRMNC